MIILTIRTDKPEAEIGLFENEDELAYESWPAHRELAETIHARIEKLLEDRSKELGDVEGIVIFKGPGSFTGLRIGAAVANALADGLEIPIIGAKGDQWIRNGTKRLAEGASDSTVIPEYGTPPRTTKPKK